MRSITGLNPRSLLVSARAERLFVANYGGTVSVVSLSTGKIDLVADAPREPFGLAYDPTRRRLFVADSGSGNIADIGIP